MGNAAQSVLIRAPVADVWALYFEPRTWPTWVDGFGGVDGSDGYPEAGGTLRWRSTPAGRGQVTERVLEHEPRRVHRIAFSDDYSEGELTTSFGIDSGPGGDPGATRVSQALDYRIARRGVLGPLTDALFVRPQMQRSLARSLERLRHEVEEPAETSGEAAPPDPGL